MTDHSKALKGPHHLVALQAQNVKILDAVAITFGDASVAQITGKNGNGKSSLLDAFKFALGGTREIQSVPIKKGKDEASVLLDFGDIVVRKTLKAEGDGFRPSLVVTTRDGVKLPSPQAVLDTWLGPLTFDPLALVNMSPKDRLQVVKGLVPEYDFDAAELAHKNDYERRTQIGRDLAREKAASASITLDPSAPSEPINISVLHDEYAEARHHNERLERIDKAKLKVAELRLQANELERAVATELAELSESKNGITPVDLSEIEQRGKNAHTINAVVELNRRKREHDEAADDLERKREALTEKIEARQRDMAEAIASAKLPVTGLTFDSNDVMLDGLPFDQASSARQIEVAVALAMAMNPSLRVLRIKDGALLDDDHMRLIEKMACDAGYLVIMERVTPVEGVGMVVEIRGGKVAGVKPAKLKRGTK